MQGCAGQFDALFAGGSVQIVGLVLFHAQHGGASPYGYRWLMQEHRMRDKLEHQLGLCPDDFMRVWDSLVECGEVADTQIRLTRSPADQQAWPDFVKTAHSVRKDRGIAAPEPRESEEERRLRQAFARAHAVAGDARRNPDVQAFRQEVLGGRTLPPTEIARWIEDTRRADGPGAVVIVYTPILGEHPTLRPDGVWEYPPGGPPEVRIPAVLHYRTPEAGCDLRVRVASGKTLDRLRKLAEQLAPLYGWTPAAACWFVLTDTDPGTAGVRITAGVTLNDGEEIRPGPMIVELFADTSESEILAAVQEARRRSGLPRLRRQESKGLALGQLRGDHPELEPDDVDALQRAWNARVSDARWMYPLTKTGRSNFRRDLKNAEDRLLHRRRLNDIPPGPGYLGDPANAPAESPWPWEEGYPAG